MTINLSDQEAKNEANLSQTAKRGSGTANKKTRGGIKQNKKQQSTGQGTSNNTSFWEEGEEEGGGKEGKEGGAKKNNAEERSVARSPVSFSSEKEIVEDAMKDPGPCGEAGRGLGVRYVAEEEHKEEIK